MATLMLFSCQEEFLDDPKPAKGISEELVFSSREMVNSFIAGMLRRSRAVYLVDDAAGINSIYYARTVKGNDVIQADTWFSLDYQNDNREATYWRSGFSWEFPFYMINQANIAIKGIEKSSKLSEIDKNETLAQALGIRAFYYFQLVLEFQHAYTFQDPATMDAPPLYTEPSHEGKPMSTVKDVYALIIDDLKTAISKSSKSRIDKSYLNTNVLHGILARVYLTTHDYGLAAEHAKSAREGYSLNAKEYTNGFDSMDAEEWIWAMPQTNEQNGGFAGVPHAHADHSTVSYVGTFFNVEFTKLFSSSDVRNLFLNLYWVSDSDYQARVTTKFTFNFSSDYALMRSAEMLLIEAEGKARTGEESAASDLLFELQSNRDPNATKSGNTGNKLIEEILVERRKELYAELGVEWFDAKRLRRGIPRNGNHRLMGNTQLEADDKRFFLKIPQEEIDANDMISEDVNKNR